MTMLGQRWQMVVLLVNSWRWVYYVGPTLGQHQRVLEENWMAMSCWASINICLDKANIGAMWGQHEIC